MLPTEDLVHLLHMLGIPTGVDLDRLIDASHRLAKILGRPLHSQVALNGPFPQGNRLYPESVPAVYTFREAQHFRLGPAVYEGNPTPWLRAPKGEAS
jgi:hydroxymethylglutaryl-CoA lyase